MQFLSPSFLYLLLLGIIPVMLYLFRRKSKTVNVSTLVFFKTLAREHQESAWLRRLKKWLSFLLTAIVLVAAVIALARMVLSGRDNGDFRTVVILLDRSASMAVENEEGETRLAEAKRILYERLKDIPEEVGVALIAYDDRPEIVQPRTLKRRELISRLESVRIRPIADKAGAALESAKSIASLEPPAVIWHASDSVFDRDANPDSLELRELNLALDEVSNPGITAFQIRPVTMEYSQYDAYVQVSLNEAAPAPIKGRLNVNIGGMPSQFREFELDPGEDSGFTFKVGGSQNQMLRLELNCEDDDFPLDNQVLVPLPDSSPVLAAWIRPDETEDPFTRFALSAIQEDGNLELLKGTPDAWPLSEPVDAVIFDGWLPDEWPENMPVVVINPPGSLGPVLAAQLEDPVPYDSVRVGNEQHPVLFRVTSSRVAVTATAVFQTEGSLEPLWIAGNEPVLAAGEYKGQRVVVMGFSPGISEQLPLTSAFPLLVGNSLLWCIDGNGDRAGNSVSQYSAGEFVPVDGESITWSEWRDGEMREQRIPLKSNLVEMDRIGVWKTDSGNKGTSHLLSAAESNISAKSEEADSDAEYFKVKEGVAGNLKNILLAVILLVLIVESLLFHRFAVY